jgi:hypothetical protein
MVTDRKLIHYLPQFMQNYVEMQEITNTEQVEVDKLWSKTEDLLSNQFILEAKEIGIVRWESMLKISPKDTDTLEERRFRILTRLNQELPYTMTKLKEALTALCGVDGFFIDLQPANYHIDVKLVLENANNHQSVVDVLKKMIPANLTQNVVVMYNPHRVIGRMTHAQLAAYTHDQVRKEAFE